MYLLLVLVITVSLASGYFGLPDFSRWARRVVSQRDLQFLAAERATLKHSGSGLSGFGFMLGV